MPPTRTPSAPKGDKGLSHPALRLLRPRPSPGFWVARSDGSCDGNGLSSATGKWGFLVFDGEGRPLCRRSGETLAPTVTNNVSEYFGVWEAVRAVALLKSKPPGLLIEGDSKLVVEQLTGNWSSNKPELTRLRDETRDALAALGVPWSARWIPREQNSEADQLTRPETLIEDWSAWGGAAAEVPAGEGTSPAPSPTLSPSPTGALKLFVVGESSGDPAGWDNERGRELVLATSAAEAEALAGDGPAYEVAVAAPAVIDSRRWVRLYGGE
ncbi:ribonuclease HI family protein [Limnoglobus roseus]|uniref:Ribonuclease H n=1 Tax=Limnoglobus roseus TaxID=2598579 RepID=A0A5C1AK89_9BACT|nr:ribonuclease HI family protein [Limnoglobus roseus]QEL19809.1 ribonuclease H [Limnoglobus roseus]